MSLSIPGCPCCRRSDKTYKVSLLYLEASARLHRQETIDQPELDGLLADLYPQADSRIPTHILSQWITTFAPPEGEKRITRRIHPDGMVVGFSMIALLLLYQIATQQPESLPIAVILFFTVLLAYLLLRHPLLHRHAEQVRQEQEENQRIDQATEHWMRLFFCSRDRGVFAPGQERLVPLEQLSEYLREQ